MALVRDVIGGCNTALVRGLSRQIIAEMNLLVSNVLVSFAELRVEAVGAAVTPFLQSAAKEALRVEHPTRCKSGIERGPLSE